MPPPPDLGRYHRQTLLPGVGEEGQRRLLASHALVVGCGALGCAIADLLARAGIGALTLVDRDTVEVTNLQRQTLFDERDAAEAVPKAEAARRRLARINSGVTVRALVADFTPRNAQQIAGAGVGPSANAEDGSMPDRRPPTPTVILDGTDNFETRYLLNDLSVKHGIPYVYGGVVGTTGMAATFIPGRTPCLRCVFDQPPAPGASPTCDTAGVLGAAVAVVGASQAADAMKICLGRPDLVSPTLLDFDLWTGRRRQLDLAGLGERADCPCCRARRFEFLDARHDNGTTALCGRGAVQITPAASPAHRVDLPALARRLAPHGLFTVNPFLLRGALEREPPGPDGRYELTVFADGRAVIRGTTRPEVARSIYAKYVGA